jgi:NAD+ synthase
MDLEQLAAKLSRWIKDKVAEAGYKGAVLGLSGGVDSAVVAALCIKALPQNTLGLIMPCHSNVKDRAYADMVAKKFAIPTKTLTLKYYLILNPTDLEPNSRKVTLKPD